MKIRKFAMALGLTMVLGSAVATDKPVNRECSPGFYSNPNGLQTWASCTGDQIYGLTCGELADALTAGRGELADLGITGKPPGQVHQELADYIVRVFLGGDDSKVCPDD